MKFSDLQLPSNKKFGSFFTFIFAVAAFFFFWNDSFLVSIVLVMLALLFALISLIKADLLLPLNKLWMRFGLLLGMVISPIVLGAMFYLLFTPIGIIIRLAGRDELRLKKQKINSFWKVRDPIGSYEQSFKNQFWTHKNIMEFLKELFMFLKARKKLWLSPIIIVMLVFGGLLVLAQGSVIAPFIYTLF